MIVIEDEEVCGWQNTSSKLRGANHRKRIQGTWYRILGIVIDLGMKILTNEFQNTLFTLQEPVFLVCFSQYWIDEGGKPI